MGDLDVLLGLVLGTLFKVSALYSLSNARKTVRRYAAKVRELWIYPIKSCKGISFDEIECTNLGNRNAHARDRHWMIITAHNNSFLSQRLEPSLAKITPSFHGDMLYLDAPNKETLIIPVNLDVTKAKVVPCKVWTMDVEGLDCGDEASTWFSSYLNKPSGHVRLVATAPGLKLQEMSEKPTGHNLARPGDKSIYHDFCQNLIMSKATVDDVASRVSVPISAQNFRPTILVDGCSPYAEDDWKTVAFGDISQPNVELRVVRHCTRCLFTTVNPETGIKDPNEEPLKTLKKYRIKKEEFPDYGNKACLGLYMVADKCGQIRIGDTIYATL